MTGAPSEQGQALLRQAAEEVKAFLPRSHAHYERARLLIPGGTTRSRFWWPIPIFIRGGQGAYIEDIDEHRYVDCNLGFGSLVLGHRHPAVLAAVEEALRHGVLFGASTTGEADMAELIAAHVPGAERALFVNSGTEATLCALRLARAATGRGKIAKLEGGWHGWHDFVLHSYASVAGPPEQAATVPDTLGVPDSVRDSVVVLPYNDSAAFDRMRREEDLACVIVESLQGGGGALPAQAPFMRKLREVCDELGVILIVDEVITAFRLGPNGAAGHYGVRADVTTLGKIVGGGLPIGVVSGRADLLDLATVGREGGSAVVAGTFSANPMTMAAGKAQLGTLLGDESSYRHLNHLGECLRTGLTKVIADVGIQAHVTGLGSIWGMHFGGEAPSSIRDERTADHIPARLLSAYLLLEGVLMSSPAHLGFLSTAHTDADIDAVIEAHRAALLRIQREGAA